MANTQGEVVITPETLNKSFVKYRKELLMMPVYGLQKILPYLSVRQGVRYKETVGQLDGDMQLAPYNPLQLDTKDVTIKGRELETYLGSCVKAFDPNSVVQSIYGSNIVQGDGLKGVPITKAVCAFLMGKLGEHLYDCIFTAKRNSGGSTTAELFDGFKTIADKEKTAELLLSTRADAIAFDFGDRENENIDLSMLNYCQGKEVILGLISTSSLQPISTSSITLHIENAARLLPLESLHLSSQGDFRDNEGNSIITEQMMWSKIVTMKNIAKTVWGK